MGTRARHLEQRHFCAGLKLQRLCCWYRLPLPSSRQWPVERPQNCSLCPLSPGGVHKHSTRGRKVPLQDCICRLQIWVPSHLNTLLASDPGHLLPHFLPHPSFLLESLTPASCLGCTSGEDLDADHTLPVGGPALPSPLSHTPPALCSAAFVCRTTTWGRGRLSPEHPPHTL